jgi:serine phosphatase RsbU (regulator of sigma subunit)
MIARLFIYIYDRTSFAFTIALFTTTWSWVASFYGFFFVHATVNFRQDELLYMITALVVCTGIAVLLHLSYFGMFYRMGFQGGSKTIRLINRFFDKKHIFVNFKDIQSRDIEEVYSAVLSLPRNNFFAGLIFTTLVVFSIIILIYFYSRNAERIPFILLGGFFSSIIICYCTFLLTEYFSGPYKMRLEQMMFERSIKIKPRVLLSFKYKAIFMLMVVLFSMVNLTILIRRSDKSLLIIICFITLSLITVGMLIFLMLNIIRMSLETINRSTKKLAAGGSGMFFPPFSDKEFAIFSENYNLAAVEINEIRTDLETKITERTEELSTAYENLNKVYSQIQADLTLAKRIQKRIMPDNFDSFEGLDLIVHYYPMADIGGDIYDIFQLSPGCIRFFLADAIGHGIQAALITMIIKSEYEKVKTIENAKELLEWLNKSFTDLYISLNAFFSCVIVDIDTRNNKLRYASAGHPNQVIVSDTTIEILKHTGKLIGIKRDTEYDSVEKDIHAHDKVLLFTDGLFEQFNDHEEGMTEQDILEITEKHKASPINVIDSALIQSLRGYIGAKEELQLRDDITVISIEINGK